MPAIFRLLPPYFLAVLLYVQLVALIVNHTLYDYAEFPILFAWLPVLLLPYWLTGYKWVLRLLLVVCGIDGFLTICHWLVLKGPLTASSLLVLSNTNIEEAKEFAMLKDVYLYPIFLVPFLVLIYFAWRRIPVLVWDKTSKIIAVLLGLYSIVFITENAYNERLLRKGVPQTTESIISFVEEQQQLALLDQRMPQPIINLTSEEDPEQLTVLIIGESCNRKHMSLYGYSRETTPLLESRNDIYPYSNVISRYSNTLPSVLSMITESNYENALPVHQSLSLIDVFGKANFETYWLSNQSPVGVWDNAIYNIARSSNQVKFCNTHGNNSMEQINLRSYDDVLLEGLFNVLQQPQSRKFVVLHLMGNHAFYARRYPSQFSYFTEQTTDKQQTINEYDNSMRYMDFVLDSVFSMLKQYSHKHPQALASAVFISDHSENVFDENERVGHDYAGVLPNSHVEIPMILWLSDQYQKRFPQKSILIKENKSIPFMNDDLFHAMTNLNGMEADCIETARSPFSATYNRQRKRLLEDGSDYDTR